MKLTGPQTITRQLEKATESTSRPESEVMYIPWRRADDMSRHNEHTRVIRKANKTQRSLIPEKARLTRATGRRKVAGKQRKQMGAMKMKRKHVKGKSHLKVEGSKSSQAERAEPKSAYGGMTQWRYKTRNTR